MELARTFNEKKFMWDGRAYDNKQEMTKIKQEYQEKEFEVEVVEEDSKYFLFSRRLVKEVVVEGSPT